MKNSLANNSVQIIDTGPYRGTKICDREEELGLQLMRSLSPALQRRAQIYALMHDPAMPEGRWNPADQVRAQLGLIF